MPRLWVNADRLPAELLASQLARLGLPTDAALAAPGLSAEALSGDAARLVSAALDEELAGATVPEMDRRLH
jgi:hypothetical protein